MFLFNWVIFRFHLKFSRGVCLRAPRSPHTTWSAGHDCPKYPWFYMDIIDIMVWGVWGLFQSSQPKHINIYQNIHQNDLWRQGKRCKKRWKTKQPNLSNQLNWCPCDLKPSDSDTRVHWLGWGYAPSLRKPRMVETLSEASVDWGSNHHPRSCWPQKIPPMRKFYGPKELFAECCHSCHSRLHCKFSTQTGLVEGLLVR